MSAVQTATLFNHETVLLDGESFADCEFRDCRMIYAGGPAPVFKNCRFHGCDWKFDDAAANTLKFMRVLWTVGGKSDVQALIKEITAAA